MDSLTQIVLGASMGEMVAGRKIGNRAMLWGAVAGTIPDLDVFGGVFGMSPEDSLAFHRGISHSLLFAVLVPLLLALYASWYYGSGHHKKQTMKWVTGIAGLLFMLFCGAIVNAIPYLINQQISFITLTVALLVIGYFTYRLITKYINQEQEEIKMPYWRWYLLFFIAVITHPILDCCTGYGTQIFQPFSDVRIAWNNISVADPIYTGPFLIFLLSAAFLNKDNPWRSRLNYAGFIWSMLYMGWTVRNKMIVDNVFENTLQSQQIEYSRCMTTPTILNNVLWHCIAEGDDVYYDGNYSLKDSKPIVYLDTIKKNHHLIKNPDDKRIKTITWFSNDYYNVFQLEGDTIQINDLRYGPQIGADPEDLDSYIFPFSLKVSGNEYELLENDGPPRDNMNDFWNTLWTRVSGI